MKARMADKTATLVFYLVAGLIIGLLIFFVGYIFLHGTQAINWHFLTSPPENMKAGGGIGPQLFNSFYMLVLTMIFLIPVGLGAGIYMAEYTKSGIITGIIRVCIETLTSLPSIVVGLFGLLIFVNKLGWGFSLMAGAMALTVLNLPVIVRISEESIRGVQNDIKEASLALGANRWQTIVRVILPAAFPGLVTGVIITAGRVFGEAAALIFTAGQSSPILDFSNWNPSDITSPLNPFRPAATLAVHIWKINSEGLVPDVRKVADGSAAILILVVLIFNIAARWLGRKIHKKLSAQ